jgi:hypothetical protein
MFVQSSQGKNLHIWSCSGVGSVTQVLTTHVMVSLSISLCNYFEDTDMCLSLPFRSEAL